MKIKTAWYNDKLLTLDVIDYFNEYYYKRNHGTRRDHERNYKFIHNLLKKNH